MKRQFTKGKRTMRISKVLVLLLVIYWAVAGCSKPDPCPPGVGTSVTVTEADRRLEEAARARSGKSTRNEDAVQFECTDVVSNTTSQWSHAPQSVWLSYGQVLECLELLAMKPPVAGQSLSLCLELLARLLAADRVIRGTGTEPTEALVNDYAMKGVINCEELERKVEVPQDELRRDGVKDLIPVLLVVGARVLAGMMATVQAPAMFIIRPASGSDEEACVEAPDQRRKCAATAGCDDRPAGAETPDASAGSGGNVIPPGTDPGTPLPGDHL